MFELIGVRPISFAAAPIAMPDDPKNPTNLPEKKNVDDKKTSPDNPESFRFTEQLRFLLEGGVKLYDQLDAAAILIFVNGPGDWGRLRSAVGQRRVIVASERLAYLSGAAEVGFSTVAVNLPTSSPYERITEALLESVTEELLTRGQRVIALFGLFEPSSVDSLSVIRLSDHLARLTARDLRELNTAIPIETLKLVINLAVEIGQEGREGKPVGAIFVVGDSRKVLSHTRPLGFDPVRGYSKHEKNLFDPRVREGVKEIAQLDGACIISEDGTILAACRHIDCSASDIVLSKGLGARHWAAAAITRKTKAVAVCVSESSGTVRVFLDGECRFRIEPQMRRPLLWRESPHD
ncbi:DNA integrity scanning protein DisA nucleotide-binding domain protein [Thermopirellula anaerolimosa]